MQAPNGNRRKLYITVYIIINLLFYLAFTNLLYCNPVIFVLHYLVNGEWFSFSVIEFNELCELFFSFFLLYSWN